MSLKGRLPTWRWDSSISRQRRQLTCTRSGYPIVVCHLFSMLVEDALYAAAKNRTRQYGEREVSLGTVSILLPVKELPKGCILHLNPSAKRRFVAGQRVHDKHRPTRQSDGLCRRTLACLASTRTEAAPLFLLFHWGQFRIWFLH